jgi:hypothetical protein
MCTRVQSRVDFRISDDKTLRDPVAKRLHRPTTLSPIASLRLDGNVKSPSLATSNIIKHPEIAEYGSATEKRNLTRIRDNLRRSRLARKEHLQVLEARVR